MRQYALIIISIMLIMGCTNRIDTQMDTQMKSWVNDNADIISGPDKHDTQGVDKMAVLYIIAQKDFRDEEFAEPKAIVEDAGYRVDVASITAETASGMLGMTVKPDLAVKDANASDYDMIVVAGGSGAPELAEHEEVPKLLKEADSMGKLIGAICIAPTILAKAGLLEGKRATVYKTAESVDILKSGKATYVEEPVVRDGRIITANGPKAATRFGQELVNALAS